MKALRPIIFVGITVVVLGITIVILRPQLFGITRIALTDNTMRDDWPTVTPDGAHIAFMRKTSDGNRIFTIPAEDGAPTVQRSEIAVATNHITVTELMPLFANYLICFNGITSDGSFELYTVQLLGTSPEGQVTTLPDASSAWKPWMSGNGSHFVFIKTPAPPSASNQNEWEINYTIPGFGQGLTITDDTAWQKGPTVSNGRKVVYVEHVETENPGAGDDFLQRQHFKIMLNHLGLGPPSEIEGNLIAEFREGDFPICESNILGIIYPIISSDGSHVVFASDWSLKVIDLAAGTPADLLEETQPLIVFDYNISQNGEWIVFSGSISFSDPLNIYRIRTDGTDFDRLTDSVENDVTPSISNNGRVVTFVRWPDCDSSLKEIRLLKLGVFF